MRQMILSAIPTELYSAVAAGVGVFIAFIGLKNAGLVVANSATFVTLGNLRSASAAVSVFGLIVIAVLLAKKVSGAILIGIASSTVLGIAVGLTKWNPVSYAMGDLTATAFKLDLASTAKFGFWEIIFVFLFVDLFDNLGTLVAVGREAGLVDATNQIPRLNRILMCDSMATIVSSLAGTSTVVSYIESAAGVEAGGRSGVTAIVTGILFILVSLRATADWSDSYGGDGSGPHHRGQSDDGAWRGDRVEEARSSDSFVPDNDHDSTHIQHCEWFGFRLRCLLAHQDWHGRRAKGALASLCADRTLHCAVCVYGGCEWLGYCCCYYSLVC